MEPARNICIRKIAPGVTSAPRTFQIALLIGRIEPDTNWKRHGLGFMSVVCAGFVMHSSHVLQAHRALAVLCRGRRDQDYCNYGCVYGSDTCFHRDSPSRENLSLGNVPENMKRRKGLTHVSDSQSEAAWAISPIRAILSMSLVMCKQPVER